jgi:hypothetical protein
VLTHQALNPHPFSSGLSDGDPKVFALFAKGDKQQQYLLKNWKVN